MTVQLIEHARAATGMALAALAVLLIRGVSDVIDSQGLLAVVVVAVRVRH